MPLNVAELAYRLAREAEAVCRHYLSNGRRVGNYWQVGDVRNTTGRSMFVRLKGGDIGKRPAGKWTDAATGEHGDLRRHQRKLRLGRFPRCHRGSTTLPEPATIRTEIRQSIAPVTGADRLAGIGTAPVCHVKADCRNSRGNLSADTRHRRPAWRRQPAIPSTLLLSFRGRRSD
jgi:nucleotidyltransferase/DNA polymerase involved in DNA repair